MFNLINVEGVNYFETTLVANGIEETIWRFKYNFPIREDLDDKYDVYLFNKSGVLPQEILQLCVHTNINGKLGRTGRIGWSIPIQAYSEDASNLNIQGEKGYPHFLPYAYHAFEKLLRREFNGQTHTLTPLKRKGESSISDWYGSDAVIFVISNNRRKAYAHDFSEEFELHNFFPSAIQHGYWYINNINNTERKGISLNIDNLYAPSANGIVLRRTSKEIEDGYINDLFTNILIRENSLISQFHLLYQIIEILIDKVFLFEMQTFPSRFSEENADFYILREELARLTNEGNRIIKLYDNFLPKNNKPDLADLGKSCEKLLQNIGKIVPNTSPKVDSSLESLIDNYKNDLLKDISVVSNDRKLSDEAIEKFILAIKGEVIIEDNKKEHPLHRLYKVRSTTFHEFSRIGSVNLHSFKDINSNFLNIVIEFIVRFTVKEMIERVNPTKKVETIETINPKRPWETWIRRK